MLHPDGLEVFIKNLDRDESYKEYIRSKVEDVPESKSMGRYIEVAHGQRYSISVTCTKDFHFHESEALKIDKYIDGSAVRRHNFVAKKAMRQNGFHRERASQEINGTWLKAGLCFGHIEIGKQH
jgi:hypothetical protein